MYSIFYYLGAVGAGCGDGEAAGAAEQQGGRPRGLHRQPPHEVRLSTVWSDAQLRHFLYDTRDVGHS